MAAQDKVTFKQDLTEPVKIRHYEGVVFTGDDCGNLIKVALFDGGTPYSGGGTVSATAVLADGTTFPLTQGSITGNMVSVPLEAGALAVSGLMGLYVKISGDGIICTVLNAIFTVQATDTGMVPAAMVTTVNELVAAIRDAQDSIPADLTNLLAAVAPTFSTATAYSAGAYVWQGGKLYRFTAAHPSGTWTGTDAVEVALGNDIADLKSAFTDFAGLETTWKTGFWHKDAFNSDMNFKHSDYIPIKELAIPIHYTIKVVNTVPSYILFDEEKNYIKKYFDTESTSLVEIDDVVSDFEGAAYVVFESYTGNNVYTPSLKYCDLSDSRVIGFIKEITLNDIPNKLITQDKLSFATYVLPTNLFNYQNPDCCIRNTWYYSTTIGSVVSPSSSIYTTSYVAIKIPLHEEIEKVTFGIYPNVLTRKVYWVGAVDVDMKLISYQTVNTQPPITYAIPSGAKYLLVSYSLDASNFDAYIPTIIAVSGETITGYSEYHDPYYLLENCRTETEPEPEDSAVKLMLPESYNTVVGDTIQIFYKGIISATKPEVYDVKVQCTQGSAYTRYFELTPTTAGNVSAVFSLYDQSHNLIDSKSVVFNVKAKASSPGTQKNVLCVGDSLTTGGVWPVELHRRLSGTGGTPAGDGLTNINFIGSRVVSGVGYEGYGGWTFNSYNTENVDSNVKIITCSHDKTEALDQHSIYKDGNNDTWKLETIESGSIKIIAVSSEGNNFPSAGTLTWVSGGTNHSSITYTASANAPGNPFWNTTSNKVDFAAYATEQGVSSIDYVLVLLGWNSAALTEDAYKEQAQTFITNVHTSFPNAKIVLMGLEIPARDGLGVNYGANGIYSDYYGLMQYVFNVDAWYSDLVNDNSNVYAVNLSGQFDTEYNMPTGTRKVNTRNSEMITYQSNGVHPATPGYYQIADAFYRWITGALN